MQNFRKALPSAAAKSAAQAFYDPSNPFKYRPGIGLWAQMANGEATLENLTALEKVSAEKALKHLASYMEGIGWETRFCDLSSDQVKGIISVIVGGYQDAELERLTPPLETPNPFEDSRTASADLNDDIPF